MNKMNNKILLVEDQIITAAPIISKLKNAGYDVYYVFNGEAAVSIIDHGVNIDLMVMDIDLGSGICGITASTLINAISKIPVLFFTSHPENYIISRIGKIPYAGYLSKKSSAELFIKTVKNIFHPVKDNRIRLAAEDRFSGLISGRN